MIHFFRAGQTIKTSPAFFSHNGDLVTKAPGVSEAAASSSRKNVAALARALNRDCKRVHTMWMRLLF